MRNVSTLTKILIILFNIYPIQVMACDGCHQHDPFLVFLSVIIAIAASYIALDLARNLVLSVGHYRWLWLFGGSLALGVGIWSMHFVAMLAFSVQGISISYDIPLILLSILVAILASALALTIVSRERISFLAYVFGSLCMGAAIAGMHYLGIASMKMRASISWEPKLVTASIVIAVVSSFVALLLAFKLRSDFSRQGFYYRLGGAVLMGFAIAGMHYTAMAAMNVVENNDLVFQSNSLLATNGLALAVILATILIFGIAIVGSVVNKAITNRTNVNKILQDAIKSRDEFFSIASHEFKTPLTSIKLQTQLSIRSLEHLPEQEKTKISRLLIQTDKSVARLERLVDDMLDISRMAGGKLTLQVEEFNLSELVNNTVERLAPLFLESNNQVSVHIPKDFPVAWDKFRIEQSLTNLLTNAIKYGQGKPICVCVSESGNDAILIVQDQGQGIALKDQEKIFERFERLPSTAGIKGLGIGLHIAKQIVLMHSGKIEVRSEANKGSEFIVTIPKTVVS